MSECCDLYVMDVRKTSLKRLHYKLKTSNKIAQVLGISLCFCFLPYMDVRKTVLERVYNRNLTFGIDIICDRISFHVL